MTQVVEFRHDRPDRAVRLAARALRGGAVVALPDEAGWCLAVSALASTAAGRLPTESGAALGLGDAGASADWLPPAGVPAIGRRLARRCWPGPVELSFPADPEVGLPARLPAPPRALATSDGRIRLRVPAHPAALAAVRSARVPVLLASPAIDGSAVAAGDFLAGPGAAADLALDDGSTRPAVGPTVIELDGSQWRVAREGAFPADEVARLAVCLVVFVCTGNTCRSPMAEAIFKRLLADRLGCDPEELPRRGFLVLSAGLAAARGQPATPEAVTAAGEHGGDLTAHRSRPASPDLLAQADHIVTMTRGHLLALGERYRPAVSPRLLCVDGADLSDPIGGDPEVYRECARTVRRHLEGFVAEVVSA